jgi:hypothetical protein
LQKRRDERREEEENGFGGNSCEILKVQISV